MSYEGTMYTAYAGDAYVAQFGWVKPLEDENVTPRVRDIVDKKVPSLSYGTVTYDKIGEQWFPWIVSLNKPTVVAREKLGECNADLADYIGATTARALEENTRDPHLAERYLVLPSDEQEQIQSLFVPTDKAYRLMAKKALHLFR